MTDSIGCRTRDDDIFVICNVYSIPGYLRYSIQYVIRLSVSLKIVDEALIGNRDIALLLTRNTIIGLD